MRFRSFGVAVMVVMSASSTLAAQSVGNMVVTDVKNGVGDMVGTWLSPFHDSAKDWLLAGGAVALSAAVSPADAGVDNFFLHHRGSFGFLSPFREGGVAFSGSTITPAAGALYVVALATKSRTLRDAIWGCVASYGTESLVRTQVIYRVVSRVRPDSLRTNGGSGLESKSGDQYKFSFGNHGWGQQATPAGHVGNVMACASFLGHRFHMGWGAPVAYAVVGAVGVGRMVDRRHWLSDTVLGSFFGYAIGNTIAARSKARLARDQAANGGAASTSTSSGESSQFYVAPEGGGQVGFGFTRRF